MCIQKIFLLLIILNYSGIVQSAEKLDQGTQDQIHPGNCDSRLKVCFPHTIRPFKNNFILAYLESMDLETKLKNLNSFISHYALKDVEIKQTESKGFGLFAKEDIKQIDTIVKFKARNVVNNFKKINFGLFFKKTLTLKHSKLKLPKYQRQKNLKFILNFYYHFTRIEESFLKNDLVGLPTDYMPILKFTVHEFLLLKSFPSLQKLLLDNMSVIKDTYTNFHNVSPEEQSFLFQRDEMITFEEYLYIISIYLSKGLQAEGPDNYFLIPVMHYANHKDHVQQGEGSYEVLRYKNYVTFVGKAIEIMDDKEFVYYYGAIESILLASYYGFFPQSDKFKCYDKAQILDDNLSKSFDMPMKGCVLDWNLFLAYNMIGKFLVMRPDERDICYQLTDDGTTFDSTQDQLQYMNFKCKEISIDQDLINEKIWNQVIERLEKLYEELDKSDNKISEYIDYRKQNGFEPQHYQNIQHYKAYFQYEKVMIRNNINVLQEQIDYVKNYKSGQ